MPDWFWVIFWILVAIGFFSDFFGLLTRWENRGSEYIVYPEELDTVMNNLYELKAFHDSDGVVQVPVKIKCYSRQPSTQGFYYAVKIPNWIFKGEEVKLTEAAKRKLIGLTAR